MNKAIPGEGLARLGLGHWNLQSMYRRKAMWLLTLYGTPGLILFLEILVSVMTSICFLSEDLSPPSTGTNQTLPESIYCRWLLTGQPCKHRASLGRCLCPDES